VVTEVISCHKMDWKPYWHNYWTEDEKKRIMVLAKPDTRFAFQSVAVSFGAGKKSSSCDTRRVNASDVFD
jgi:hypothetical protein